jgi:hypothetical protein
MSDEDLLACELEENTERLDLDDYQTSRQRMAEIKIERAAIGRGKEGDLSGERPVKSPSKPAKHRASGQPRGRPPPQLELLRAAIKAVQNARKDCPVDKVAERLGRALEILEDCHNRIAEDYEALKQTYRRGM